MEHHPKGEDPRLTEKHQKQCKLKQEPTTQPLFCEQRKDSIIQFIENDPRSPAEILQSLQARIKSRATHSMSDCEAVEAARRLIGFFETLVDKTT